jgi:competence protein ComEC
MPSFLPYLSFISGACAYHLFQFFPASTILLSSLLLYFLYRRREAVTLIHIALFLCAFVYTGIRDEGRASQEPYSTGAQVLQSSSHSGQLWPFSGFVSGLPSRTEYGYLQSLILNSPFTTSASSLYLQRPLKPGTLLKGHASIRMKEGRRNPGMKTRKGSIIIRPQGDLSIKNSTSARWIPDKLRWPLYHYFHQQFTSDVASLLSALVIGHRDSHNPGDLNAAYSKTGLAHLMSISGTHFGLFTFMVFSLIRFTSRWLPYRFLVRLTSRISIDEAAALLTVPFIIFYLLLSGGRIPALRSFIMINIFLLGLLIGRKGQWSSSLLIAASLILFIDPSSIKSISFQLSFIAVLSIGLTLSLSEEHLHIDKLHPALQKLLKLILVTAGASLGTMPLVLYYFHSIPTLTLLTNLIFTPLICFIVLPLGVFGGIIYLATGFFPAVARCLSCHLPPFHIWCHTFFPEETMEAGTHQLGRHNCLYLFHDSIHLFEAKNINYNIS